MPRRLITSEIFRNEKFGTLNDAGRLFFIGCFSNADDDGRLRASAKYLKALFFPYDNDKTADDVEGMRDECNKLGLIHIYHVNGCEYLYCIGWEEHQVIRKDRRRPSTIPAPNMLTPTTVQPTDNQVATSGQPTDNQPQPIGCLIQSNTIQSNTIQPTDNQLTTSGQPKENIYKIYEQNMGIITPMIVEQLKDAEREYSADWVKDAINEAVNHNTRKWAYALAILERWKIEGKGEAGHGKNKSSAKSDDRYSTEKLKESVTKPL